jgi:integron integrase
MDEVRRRIRLKHYSLRTEQAYVAWIRRFIFANGKRHPRELGSAEVETFLSTLATVGEVAAGTQNLALSAILFLYREVLRINLPWLKNVVRAKRPRRVPVVLALDEVTRLLAAMDGRTWLLASLLYGTGMRLMECLRLRVKDIDFARNEIVVRDGKGGKDRRTMLPRTLVEPLQREIERARQLHARDLAAASARRACRTRSRASIRARRASSLGSTCFHRCSVRAIRWAVVSAVTISMMRCFRARSSGRARSPGSPNR